MGKITGILVFPSRSFIYPSDLKKGEQIPALLFYIVWTLIFFYYFMSVQF